MAWYVDSSAAMKVLVAEAETMAVRRWWRRADVWSSELLVTEVNRAGARAGVTESAIERVLDGVSIILPSSATFLTAGRLDPPELRSLDALHLAAALELEHDLDGFVTYDKRQAAAAAAIGVAVSSPGRPVGWWN